jgi:hypothetical protein
LLLRALLTNGKREVRFERVAGYECPGATYRRRAVSSGYITGKDEPGPDEIGEALREAVFENPRLSEMPVEEVARQLVLEGHLKQEPSPVLVAEMLDALEAEEEGFEADELSEEGNPT